MKGKVQFVIDVKEFVKRIIFWGLLIALLIYAMKTDNEKMQLYIQGISVGYFIFRVLHIFPDDSAPVKRVKIDR